MGRASNKRVIKTPDNGNASMLIPMADVPRWYAERKPRDTIAISHGD